MSSTVNLSAAPSTFGRLIKCDLPRCIEAVTYKAWNNHDYRCNRCGFETRLFRHQRSVHSVASLSREAPVRLLFWLLNKSSPMRRCVSRLVCSCLIMPLVHHQRHDHQYYRRHSHKAQYSSDIAPRDPSKQKATIQSSLSAS